MILLCVYHGVQEEGRDISGHCREETLCLLMSMQNTISVWVTGRLGWEFKYGKKRKQKTFHCRGDWTLQHVCPETLWSLHPLRYSKFSLSCPWATCSRWPCIEHEGGTTVSQEASTNLSSSVLLFGSYICLRRKCNRFQISGFPPPGHLTVYARQPLD